MACQTCHIPTFAKAMPTKINWDWSTAGQDIKVDEQVHGMEKRDGYDKKKGNFKWAKVVVPVYNWYNDNATVYLRGEKIDPAKITELNAPVGSIKDKTVKIYRFKVHTGKQFYGKVNQYFLTPKVWPTDKEDKDAYWKNFDWDKPVRAGSEASGQAYSGSFDFVLPSCTTGGSTTWLPRQPRP